MSDFVYSFYLFIYLFIYNRLVISRKSFLVSLPPNAVSNNPPQQKMAALYIYLYRALHMCSDSSNLSNELNYLKYFVLSRGWLVGWLLVLRPIVSLGT